MALELKNDPGLGTSDGLRFASPRAAACVATRYLLTINVDPTALRAIVEADLRQPTFKFFTKLPVELQLMVWELALEEGPSMIVVPFVHDERFETIKKVRPIIQSEVNWTSAALLGVCKLAREAATRVCMSIT